MADFSSSANVGLVVTPEVLVGAEHPAAGQPAIRWSDHSQHNQRAVAEREVVALRGRESGRQPGGFLLVRSADQPSVLPVLAGEGFEPIEDPVHAPMKPLPLLVAESAVEQ
ncbi:hypothetical protein [Nocardia brevicatena]|uniref:hypothetical protein n=1 Tax=Nocardia brevicatena TaxID=37327 RepID=UPI0012FB1674|nr:hypothetical protein [Nocardia brevicatena]